MPRRMFPRANGARSERPAEGDPELGSGRSGSPVRVTISTHIDAAAEQVLALYADPARWPTIFPATIVAARVVRAEGGELVVEVQHRREGKVPNRLRQVSPTCLALEESKRRYDATFVSEFIPEPGGMRYTLHGAVRMKGAYRLLSPFLRPVMRAQMRRYAVEPLRAAAEQEASAARRS
ncbi:MULTISPECIES: SRPBCC family protein [Anaeromyxobacter]|uniref:SRPBCC family protein n=1 Tax=Anaeromyxobacter TaxID=161492 RepID=UPI001F59F433|nr:MULTISPECIES: SRPBCC family protein [unclassified Anaeromyxobacter]